MSQYSRPSGVFVGLPVTFVGPPEFCAGAEAIITNATESAAITSFSMRFLPGTTIIQANTEDATSPTLALRSLARTRTIVALRQIKPEE
jgi:hypothetical protein